MKHTLVIFAGDNGYHHNEELHTARAKMRWTFESRAAKARQALISSRPTATGWTKVVKILPGCSVLW